MSVNHIIQENNKIKIQLEYLILQEGEYIVIYCPALELTSYGSNVDEAKKNFSTEMEIFIEETRRKGTFHQYLKELGWKYINSSNEFIPPYPSLSKWAQIFKEGVQMKGTDKYVCLA